MVLVHQTSSIKLLPRSYLQTPLDLALSHMSLRDYKCTSPLGITCSTLLLLGRHSSLTCYLRKG